MNTQVNAFLALLQGRPEDFRRILSEENQYDRRYNHWGVLEARIREAADNIRSQAVQEAIRSIYRDILGVCPTQKYPSSCQAECDDAFYEGVSAIENILDEALKNCKAKEKRIGPPSTE